LSSSSLLWFAFAVCACGFVVAVTGRNTVLFSRSVAVAWEKPMTVFPRTQAVQRKLENSAFLTRRIP
jgi:hypothetical protein